jgi:uncharacterized membrane protein
MRGLPEPLALAGRVVASRRRLFAGIASGLVVAASLPAFASAALRWIIAWDVGMSVFLVLALLLSWLMMQFTLALRYAHEYYAISGGWSEVDRGLNFPREEHPDYMDFRISCRCRG